MIKLVKENMPPILVDKYEQWTKELKAAYEEGKVPNYIKTRYTHKTIKELIIKETNGKCAYCESRILANSFGDIEHIIPKTKDLNKWFEWENLTLACQRCNNGKSDYYNEELDLLDPYIDNIPEHLVFDGPFLMPKSKRGATTIYVIDLNRTDLYENRKRFYENTVIPYVYLYNFVDDPAVKRKVLIDIQKLTREDKEFSYMVSKKVNEILMQEIS